jgi:hypothetical protein
MSAESYHRFVPAPGQSNIAGPTPHAHTQARMRSPRAQELFGTWAKLAAAPFQGLTVDGHVQPGLFALAPQDAPTPAMVEAANALLGQLTREQRAAMCLPVDSQLWRHWQNTELYVERHGLRLDENVAPLRDAVMAVVRASLSRKGYDITNGVMRLNRFLGDLVGGQAVLGEWAYTFCLFGNPAESEPWGWQLFGHHLSLNCFVIGRQMVLSPCFLGAEPNYADAGPFAGTHLFEDEERAGLALMRSLSASQQRQAIVAHALVGGDLPPGLRASALSANQQRELLDLVAAYVAPLPSGPLAARLAEVERHLGDTHFCWIGGFEETNAFYYRIQSPVIFIEFDHHAGVFLTNAEPAKFHVHTIVRTPNGNDYGIDLLRLHYQQAAHHRHE